MLSRFNQYRVLPVESVVYNGPTVRIGAFRCPSGHPMFRDSGPIQLPCFVFPRTTVAILRGGRPIIASPNLVTIYNEGDEYDRKEVVEGAGDQCDWFQLEPAMLADLAESFGRPSSSTTPFARSWVPSNAELYLAQRRTFNQAAAGLLDGLAAEEAVVSLAVSLFRAMGQEGNEERESSRGRGLVGALQEILATDLDQPLSLAFLAKTLKCSIFHLCRTFKRATGSSPHEFRQQVRMRAALERLAETDDDVLTLALDLGFSSHSHFSHAFRKRFGITPSSFRHSNPARRVTALGETGSAE